MNAIATRLTRGYEQYRSSLARVDGLLNGSAGAVQVEASGSSDDLSSDWDSDNERSSLKPFRKFGDTLEVPPSAWRKVRNAVHWSPFIQTYKKNKSYPWIQLAGHQGNFKSGAQGTILKKLSGQEEVCLKQLSNDHLLSEFVPDFKGRVELEDGGVYLELEDLLADFDSPSVMDIKIGVRTYLEEELAKAREKPKLRKDMYDKMVQVDPNEPTLEEHTVKAVTKPRYMIWRETISSTACLGFRIEGIKLNDGTSTKDFKTTKSRDQVKDALTKFVAGFEHNLPAYLRRLESLHAILTKSDFFATHEFIGSSLLFVHDKQHCGVWLIDFAKTIPVPEGIKITHKDPWEENNHEDGYLIGLTNLISIFREICSTTSS